MSGGKGVQSADQERQGRGEASVELFFQWFAAPGSNLLQCRINNMSLGNVL